MIIESRMKDIHIINLTSNSNSPSLSSTYRLFSALDSRNLKVGRHADTDLQPSILSSVSSMDASRQKKKVKRHLSSPLFTPRTGPLSSTFLQLLTDNSTQLCPPTSYYSRISGSESHVPRGGVCGRLQSCTWTRQDTTGHEAGRRHNRHNTGLLCICGDETDGENSCCLLMVSHRNTP